MPVTGADDRSIAVGLLLDSPRPLASIDEGIRVAEGLRRRYGIDTGNPIRDREEASRRAGRELLEGRRFSDEEIAAMAESLGYSLDPEICRDACENVRNLAVLESKKRVLEAASAGRPGPGTPPEP